ncbi:tripartite tricarboxylate transporter substrate binding protein [Roseomonas eburnea]|uniref:Tripartite tricarboxylate transporter substrate binding protein n=1 Tax=Neoroseomonas eburnea TaxID=1346889 RepID=A0A9X9XFZ2_9PROT|nr:tripartite tricarboxylate transporter substrate binding protein [Neoroseomonas eburnea]MBR0682628.1 tripartite tricarboxylate transporter substrate binding protein [Neoroseomonas eburnea]
MTNVTRRLLLGAALAAPGIARAEDFPTRSLRLVVPFPPGGAADITARLVAERMTPLLRGQPVVIDNRPGAGGNIAGEVVARSTPDGYTLFLGGATILCANKYLYRNGMPFDGLTDFAHISRVSVGTTLMVARADKPWRNFQDFVADAKRRPGQITAGSSGLGTISHLSLSKLMRSADIDITHVPYRGLSPSLNDLLGGQVDILFDGIPALIPHVREGRLRALAVGSQQRVTYVPGLEQTPGMAELLPGSGMDMEFWYCISGAAGTPAPVMLALHRATVGAVRRPDYREKLMPLGFTPVWDESPDTLAAFIRSQAPVWRDLVALSGARLD